MKSFEEKIDELISPDSGKREKVTDEDQAFIKEYQDGISNLSKEEKLLAFSNVIRKSGHCGFGQFGTIDYLINTDTRNRYRVTIRTFWRTGINSGQFDKFEISEAGGRMSLGCTYSGHIPVTDYTRQVVGETKI